MVRNYENNHKWKDGKHGAVPPILTALGPVLLLTEAVKAGLLRFSREGLTFLLLCKQCCCIFFAAFQIVSNNVLFDPCTQLACVMKTTKLIEVAKWGLRTA